MSERETEGGGGRTETRSVPLGGGGGAPGAGGGYISPSDDAHVPGGRLSDGGGGAGEGVVLRDLPPSPWELRAAAREHEGAFPVSETWRADLVRGDRGGLVKSVRNLMLILRNDDRWSDRFRLNVLTMAVELDGAPITDSDLMHARGLLERDYSLMAGEDLVRGAVRLAAEYRPHDPRRDYLAGLAWDGVPRIEKIAGEWFGCEAPLAPRMLGAFFVGAVRRAFEPGCKHDTMLILLGDQGYRKSTFFDSLASPWFCDSRLELGSRDGQLVASGKWIIELAEVDKDLAGKADDSEVKAVLSSRSDDFRRPYASTSETIPRSFIYVGTTNKRTFLRDATGSRRYHVVEVRRRIVPELVAAAKDQLWAEAVHAYRLGLQYWLTDEEEAARELAAGSYRRVDPWADIVTAYLSRHENLTAVNRKAGGARYVVPVTDLLSKALGLDKKDHRAHAPALAETMDALGADRDRAKVTRGEGLSAVRMTEHVYVLPETWAPNSDRLADGSKVDREPETDDAPPSAAWDFPAS